ncbi:unnamed protein product [Mytilus coruscus]|uniref:Integrase catalytic domain-containing protein n=1 Tax=Mytilus coruscus TaxID=42192 RepID=A0A6J8EQ95_MYTCO|nr:unnamed protein product [Mytilus coruscus]
MEYLDFLLKEVSIVNYQRMVLHTIHNQEIQCWIGGKANMICRVEIKDNMTILPMTSTMMPVEIPGVNHLTEYGFIEGTTGTAKSHYFVNVVNYGDNEVKLYKKEKIGTCESYTEHHLNPQQIRTLQKDCFTASAEIPEHLTDLLQRSSTYLIEDQRQQLSRLLSPYQNVFSRTDDDIGRTDLVTHRINTGNAIPFRQRSRHMPLGKQEMEKSEVNRMLDKGIIEPSSSPWASNIVLVMKKNASPRRFVKGFAAIARPMHKICEKNSRFVWNDECQKAFEQLKNALTSTPVLAYPLPNLPFILDTDTSDKAVGAVLSQIQDGLERFIAYMSKSMNIHEQAYCEVLLRTDNAAVSWMNNLKKPTGQTARWLEELGTYNLTVTHRAGRKHSNADALSRRPCKSCERQESGNHISDDETDEIQLEESDFVNQELHENEEPTPRIEIVRKNKPDWDQVSKGTSYQKTIWRQWDRLTINNGMLYRKFYCSDKDDVDNFKLQLLVPKSHQKTVLKYFHDVPSAGHLGPDKMLSRIQQLFYWPAMRSSITRYCKECDQYAARKSLKRNKAPLGQYLVSEPMERVAIDILGPLPLTKRQKPFGSPLQLHSDQGRSFEAKLFQDLCDLLKIDKTRSTSQHPQSNGSVKRFNRTLLSMLTFYCQNDQRNWDEILPQVMMAYRSSVHASTGQTPNMMMFGRNIFLPMEAVIPRPDGPDESTTPETDKYINELQDAIMRPSSQVEVKCWLCPMTFRTRRQLKNHLAAAPHKRLSVVCVWCPEEKSYRRIVDLKEHIMANHRSKIEIMPYSFIVRTMGFGCRITQRHMQRYAVGNQEETNGSYSPTRPTIYEGLALQQLTLGLGDSTAIFKLDLGVFIRFYQISLNDLVLRDHKMLDALIRRMTALVNIKYAGSHTFSASIDGKLKSIVTPVVARKLSISEEYIADIKTSDELFPGKQTKAITNPLSPLKTPSTSDIILEDDSDNEEPEILNEKATSPKKCKKTENEGEKNGKKRKKKNNHQEQKAKKIKQGKGDKKQDEEIRLKEEEQRKQEKQKQDEEMRLKEEEQKRREEQKQEEIRLKEEEQKRREEQKQEEFRLKEEEQKKQEKRKQDEEEEEIRRKEEEQRKQEKQKQDEEVRLKEAEQKKKEKQKQEEEQQRTKKQKQDEEIRLKGKNKGSRENRNRTKKKG